MLISAYASPWLEFLLCLIVIGYAGVKLSVFGDVIADKTGLGGSWVGLIILATVTSLPELVTGAISVSIAGLPDIAVGNALGACVINLFVFVLLDFFASRRVCLSEIESGAHPLGQFRRIDDKFCWLQSLAIP